MALLPYLVRSYVMKIMLTIDWCDYYLEGTAAEAAALNTALSKCVKIAGNVDIYAGNGQTVALAETGLRHSVRFLHDNCTITLPVEE